MKNRVAQKKRSRQKSVEAVRKEEVKLQGGRNYMGVGFVTEVSFKPGVKARWAYFLYLSLYFVILIDSFRFCCYPSKTCSKCGNITL